MLGHLAGHDIPVITLGDRYEYIHLFDAGFLQSFFINTVAE